MSASVLFDVPGPRARRRQTALTVVGTLILAGVLGWILRILWVEEQITPDKWEAFTDPDILEALGEGLLVTLTTAATAIVLAVAWGAVLASARLSDHGFLRWPAVVLTEFFRAVPLLLMIIFLFLAYGSTLDVFWSLVLALMLYNGAVLAEIFRAGILSVPRGQSEAAYALGLRKTQVMTQILAPQAVRSMMPVIISQCVVVLKDTALGVVIGSEEIVGIAGRIYISPQYNNPLAVGLFLAAVFIAINYALSRLAVWLEGRQRRTARAPTPAVKSDLDTGA